VEAVEKRISRVTFVTTFEQMPRWKVMASQTLIGISTLYIGAKVEMIMKGRPI